MSKPAVAAEPAQTLARLVPAGAGPIEAARAAVGPGAASQVLSIKGDAALSAARATLAATMEAARGLVLAASAEGYGPATPATAATTSAAELQALPVSGRHGRILCWTIRPIRDPGGRSGGDLAARRGPAASCDDRGRSQPGAGLWLDKRVRTKLVRAGTFGAGRGWAGRNSDR